MAAAATVAAVGPAIGSKFVAAEMFDACAAMAASAEYTDLVYEIAFLHGRVFKIQK